MKTLILILALIRPLSVLSVLQSLPDNQQCVGHSLDFSRLKKLTTNDLEALMGDDPQQPARAYSRSKTHNIIPESEAMSESFSGMGPPECLGMRHRLQEIMGGVPVYGADIMVTTGNCLTDDTDYYGITYDGSFLTTSATSGGSIQNLNGHTFNSVNVQNGYEPSQNKEQATEAMALHLEVDNSVVGDPTLEVFVSTGGDFLAYRSYIIVEDSLTTDLIELVMDAHDLSILSKCSLAADTSDSYQQRMLRPSNHHRNLFNCETCATHGLPVVWTGGTTSCSTSSLYLDDTMQSTICAKGVNLNDDSDVVGPGPVEDLFWRGTLDCMGGKRCEAVVLPTCRDALSDIQFAGVAAMQFLRDHLGFRGGLSEDAARPVSMKAYAHYQYQYCNAFYSPSTESVYFGDCNCHTWAPLAAVDIVGHEIFHAVSRHSSGLVYSGQSGGLNEAYSDVFGTVLEFIVDDYNDPPDFTIAEQVGQTLRNMEFPLQSSIASVCDYQAGMNVHYASGALNKAYVNAVRSCEANGCDSQKGCAILLGTLLLYSNIHGLTQTSDFLDAAEASCRLIGEFFTVRRPSTRCGTTEAKSFIQAGWATVDVAISDSGCMATTTGSCATTTAPRAPPTPEPSPRPTRLPTRQPTTPSPTPSPVESPSDDDIDDDGDKGDDDDDEGGCFDFVWDFVSRWNPL